MDLTDKGCAQAKGRPNGNFSKKIQQWFKYRKWGRTSGHTTAGGPLPNSKNLYLRIHAVFKLPLQS